MYLIVYFVVVVIIVVLILRWFSGHGGFKRNVFLPLPPINGGKQIPIEEVERLITLDIHEVREQDPEVLEKKYDIICIGSGISGLISSSILGRAGKKVLILEQHDRLGGYTHDFKEPGKESGIEYCFCPGIHYLGKLNTTFVLPFNVLTNGGIKFREFVGKELYELGGENISINKSGYKKVRDELISRFPEEEEAIKKYYKKMNDVVMHQINFAMKKICPWYLKLVLYFTKPHDLLSKYSKIPVEYVMDECGLKNEALKQFLYITPLAYFNPTWMKKVDFATVAMVYMGITHKNIPYSPQYGISGGGVFARTIIPNLPEGCKAVCNAKVEKILFRSGKACGIELSNGLGKIESDLVISCAGYKNTFEMLPKMIQRTKGGKKLPELIERYPYCGFFFIMFMGLNAPPEELGLDRGLYVMTGNKSMNIFDQIRLLDPEYFDGYDDCHVIAISNDIEEEFRKKHPKNSKIQIITFMNENWLDEYRQTKFNQRGNGYKEMKTKLENKVLEIVYKRFPLLEKHVEYLDSGTTLTSKHYVNNESGYGMVMNSEKWMRMSDNDLVNPINGLYFCGADILCGVAGGLYTALNLSGKILKRNLYFDIHEARKVQKRRLRAAYKKR